ncbi:hypothetical protein [Listeria sp. PSOL-1]|uniref:hypothetical protein n=1 Tax=Listeria sp. PSOL-1 TaxID=1844999 RepID=UPI0013D05DE4|nr:hypothetical protein [Listeria sp. PSOL-1]
MKMIISDLEKVKLLLAEYHSIQQTLETLTIENQAGLGLTKKQQDILYQVSEEALLFRQLAPQVKAAMKVLIERGLLFIFPDKNDFYVRLTKKGRAFVDQKSENAYTIKALLKITTELSKEEMEQVIALNQKVARLLKI